MGRWIAGGLVAALGGCFSEDPMNNDDDGLVAATTSTAPESSTTTGSQPSSSSSGGDESSESGSGETGHATDRGTSGGGTATGTEGAECWHRAFVSSQAVAYATLGSGGADGRCQADAAAADLGGEWIALLPLGGDSAQERFEPCGPVVTVDERPVASAELFWTDVHEGPIDAHADGTVTLSTDRVYTGSAFDGSIDNDCNGWSDDGEHWIGNPTASNGSWLHHGSPLPCPPVWDRRVYCVELGAS